MNNTPSTTRNRHQQRIKQSHFHFNFMTAWCKQMSILSVIQFDETLLSSINPFGISTLWSVYFISLVRIVHNLDEL
jgi:uncharacterized membrane protein